MTGQAGRYFGKYRGRVSDNDDPLKIGRIRAKVADVYGDEESGWALPCFPLAAAGAAFYAVPPVDAWVWFEFEYGDPDKPIYTGCFFPDDPTAVATTIAQLLPLIGVDKDKIAIKTDEWLITIESSGVKFASLAGPIPRTRLELTSSSIKLTNEQAPNVPSPPSATIEMSGPSVSINGTALEVT